MPRVATACLCLLTGLFWCANALADGLRAPNDGRMRFEFTARLRGGLVDGNLQTPTGGAGGTTSLGRPTLDELNVDAAPAFGARLGVLWRQHRIFLDFEQIHLDGSATLTQTLVSQGDTYPAGTRVRSTTFLDRGTVGYRYAFRMATKNRGCLEVAPGLGYSVFGFRYRLNGDNGQNAHRFYTDWVPHADLAVRWRPSRCSKIWFSGEARHSLSFLLTGGRETDLFEINARLHYDINARFDVFVGIGHEHMFKRDGQPTPNRPHVDFSPFFEVGVTFRF